jgi:hypothetical protein
VLDDIQPFPSLPSVSWRLALQLLYVVHQGKQLPLRIDLALGSEREAAQVVSVEIAEDRFDDPKAPAIQQSPITAVIRAFIAVVGFAGTFEAVRRAQAEPIVGHHAM